MSQEYNIKRFSSRINHLREEMQNAIILMMIENNVEMISFANNGNYADFDVDKAYVLEDGNYDVEYAEVIAVKVNKETKSLYILTDNKLSFADLDALESGVIFHFGDENMPNIDEDYFVAIDDTFSPFDTSEMVYISVAETLNNKDIIQPPYK